MQNIPKKFKFLHSYTDLSNLFYFFFLLLNIYIAAVQVSKQKKNVYIAQRVLRESKSER